MAYFLNRMRREGLLMEHLAYLSSLMPLFSCSHAESLRLWSEVPMEKNRFSAATRAFSCLTCNLKRTSSYVIHHTSPCRSLGRELRHSSRRKKYASVEGRRRHHVVFRIEPRGWQRVNNNKLYHDETKTLRPDANSRGHRFSF